MSKEIPGWPNYGVTSDGRVFSFSQWRGDPCRELSQHVHSDGYLTVRLNRNGRRYRRRVHQLVLRVFGEPRPSPHHEVRHLDGDPRNNHIDNLAWGTRADNAADRERHGRTSRGLKHSVAIKAGLIAKAEGGAS